MPIEIYRQLPLPILLKPRHRVVPLESIQDRVRGGGFQVPAIEGNIFVHSRSQDLTDFGSALQAVAFIQNDLTTMDGSAHSLYMKRQAKEIIEANTDAYGYDASKKTVSKLITIYTTIVSRRIERLYHNYYTSTSTDIEKSVIQLSLLPFNGKSNNQ